MRRAAAAAAFLLVLAGAALWLGPRFVDWEPWRGRLAELASDRLGRPVTLDGPVELSLLPQPVLRASGVSIGEAGAEFSLTARMLRVRLDLGGFLAGRWEPREITLVGPEMTLPWPPGALLALRPPSWITELDARIEDGRLRIGDAVLEGVTARLSTTGAVQAMELGGSFTWAGRAARFTASLGRPGWDGIATFELALTLPEASAAMRGVLVPGAGFEGTIDARGPDLAALLPSPPGAFRAVGRLNATADLVAADELAIEIAGAPARGAVALRLAPTPRLDIALLASRLDLDGWGAALRGGPPRPWPISIDLSAEAASFRGLTLRRLRGAAFLEEGRLTLSDVSVLLPGETQLDLGGATAGERLELQARFAGPDLRSTLLALGLPVEDVDPALLRRGEGRLRVVLEEAQAAIPELAAMLDGVRLSGAAVLRHGPRPALGLGLTLDHLDLARWFPQGIDPARAGRMLGALDLNLRLAADRAVWGEAVLERAALDAAVEGGRLTLRRLSGRLAEADVAASFVLALAPQLRLQDLTLEASGPSARGVVALIPGEWPDRTALAGLPLSLRLTGGGTLDALALRGGAELGELRLEAQGTLDLPANRGAASLTLRHPGAPRLLSEGFGSNAGAWLGEGSFSLVATLNGSLQALSAESFEVVAGGLRARGALTLGQAPAAPGQPAAARPRLIGRIQAERLPLPLPALRSAEPLGFAPLATLDAEIAIEAARIEAGGALAERVTTTLRLADGRLRLDELRAQIAGGAFAGTLALDATPGAVPALALEGRLTDVTLAAPLFGLPFDIAAGRGEVTMALTASGHAPAALLGSLAGDLRAALRDGVLTGFDLSAAAAASALPDALAAEAALRRALTAGATAFERLDLVGRLAAGRLRISECRITTEGGATASLEGEADLARAALDVRLSARPPLPEAPDIGLRLTGPAATPRALPEIAPWARWRAERG
jgi:hypothetical protein